jgi:serine/threonine-protein phosphatase Stp1
MNVLRQWHSRRAEKSETERVELPQFECAVRTHVGLRELNEDRLLERSDLGLWAVADGMGGHDRGDLAAQCVVDCLSAAEPRSAADIVDAVRLANTSVFARTSESRVSGSTVVILKIEEDRFDCFWAGDSELWLAHDGELRKVSRDHSVVEELVRSGLIDEQQRHSHPQAHLVTRAVGAMEAVELDHASGAASKGDVFLLCSDGLTSAISSDDLALLLSSDELEDLASRLLAKALDRGAKDNVTMVLVRVGSALEVKPAEGGATPIMQEKLGR